MNIGPLNPDACPNAVLDLASDLLEVLEAARETPWGKEAQAVKSWSPEPLDTLRRAVRLIHQAEDQLAWKLEDERAVRRVLGQEPGP